MDGGILCNCLSCLTNLIVAEELITGMTDQVEPVDDVYLDFSKAFDSVCHGLLIKKMVAIGDPPQNNPLGGGVPKEQDISCKIGRPTLGRRYRKTRRASGLCAWTPSVLVFYKLPRK